MIPDFDVVLFFILLARISVLLAESMKKGRVWVLDQPNLSLDMIWVYRQEKFELCLCGADFVTDGKLLSPCEFLSLKLGILY